MSIHIALFRGINIGGKHSLPMQELTEILGSLGYEGIRTYIQSGNAVFRCKATARDEIAPTIGKAIAERKGFEPKVLILGVAELKEAMAQNPFPVDEGKALHLYFLASSPLNPDLQKLASMRSGSEAFRLLDRVFYLHTPDGIGRSKLAAAVEKSLGVAATARNWNSVKKIAEMADGMSG